MYCFPYKIKFADHTGDFCVIFGNASPMNIHMQRNVQYEAMKQLKFTKEARTGKYGIFVLCVCHSCKVGSQLK
jgi:hypothetical protein